MADATTPNPPRRPQLSCGICSSVLCSHEICRMCETCEACSAVHVVSPEQAHRHAKTVLIADSEASRSLAAAVIRRVRSSARVRAIHEVTDPRQDAPGPRLEPDAMEFDDSQAAYGDLAVEPIRCVPRVIPAAAPEGGAR